MGEAANIQHLYPEIVCGYVVICHFDGKDEIAVRKFEDSLRRISSRTSPNWSQGLIEDAWFIKIDKNNPVGKRVINPRETIRNGVCFAKKLAEELSSREPAVEFRKQGTGSDK